MNTKFHQWGAALVAYGIVALVLPSLTGMQLRIFNLFGEHSTQAAIASVIVGAVLLIVGRSGGAGHEASAMSAAATNTPPPVPVERHAVNASGTNTCTKCGAVVSQGDAFCMQCGTPVAASPPPVAHSTSPAPSAPRSSSSGCGKGCLVVVLIVAGGAAWFFFGGSLSPYTAPSRSEPALPPRVAGTLTEFPVDPASTNRLQPTSITTQTFTPGSPSTVTVKPETLPPGIPTNTIPQVATSMTSTTYRSDPASTPVNVHVLQATNPNIGGQLAQGVAQSSGGQLQGTRVQSPTGQTYDGWSVRSATILVYVLVNPNAGNVIILYTPQPAGFEATQRLAGSVGNGRGIYDYPQVTSTFGALPASPPPGYGLTTVTNFSGDELTSSLNQFQSGTDPKVLEALQQVLQLVRMLIPDRGTVAEYRNAQNQQKGVLIGNYGSPRKASTAFRMLSWTFGLAMKSTKAPGFDALIFSDSSGRGMIFQKGPYIGLTMTPANAGENELTDLTRSVQF